jgi:hypothetical protein
MNKREKVAYVDAYDSDYETDNEYENVENNEINLAELKPGPPYTCKLLRPSNGKNPVEPKNDKFVTKTYTFDISKCDYIFDLLVIDGQIIVPKGLKVPPIEQRKKRGYCKYHNYLGHKTYQYVLFRDLVQKTINEGRLKFGDKAKPQMKLESDPLQVAETSYVEPFEYLIVNAAEAAPIMAIPEEEYVKKVQEVYPKAEDELVDFLNRSKLHNTEVMLCPRCSAVCDEEALASLKHYIPYDDSKRKWPTQKKIKKAWPYQRPDWNKSLAQNSNVFQRLGPRNTFVPSNKALVNQWMSGQYVTFNKMVMETGSSSNANSKAVTFKPKNLGVTCHVESSRGCV